MLRISLRVGGLTREEASVERLVELTLGQKAETAFARAPRSGPAGAPIVQVSELQIGSRVHDVGFTVSRGEIVSLCGLLGMGQTEVARALLGEGFDISGRVDMGGSSGIPTSPRDAIRRGAGYIPESRQEEGLFPDMSVRSNVSISSLSRLVVAPFLRVMTFSRERRLVRAAAERIGLAPPRSSRPMRTLSGGNQQKGLLARWLLRECALLICIEPTRGVDVGAKVEIYRQLEALAATGAGIIVVSTDLPEVLGVSDRILVFYRGTIIDELDPQRATEQDLLLAMQGGAEGETSGLLHPGGVA